MMCRPSKSQKFYTVMIFGEKNLPKEFMIFSNLKSQQIDVFYKVYFYSTVCNKRLQLHMGPFKSHKILTNYIFGEKQFKPEKG